MEKKNVAKAVRAKLLNIRNSEPGTDYMQVLLRYIQERMLYRLSMSQYRDNFCLKGSALLFAYEKFKARPTKDIDFLGDKISRDKETIRKAFREICTIQCPEDGLTFDNGENDIKVEDISLDKEYNGVTVTVTAHLDTIVQPFSMDIGFGDIVVPEPQELDYPLLLDDMPEVSINAYSLETVVAEKFQTMIDRALANSRMKDFYDVYSILSSDSENLKVNEDILTEAIASVFSNRGTTYTENHPLFNGEFKNDPIKQTQWNAFLKKMKYKGILPLNEVVDYITENLSPYWLSLKK
jgi:predicted nucleotidyltransferase component of viral defense system